MAALNDTRCDLIYHILERIIDCEGGHIETIVTDANEVAIYLVPDIPPALWCDDCKKRYICKSKLMARWSRAAKK